MTPLMLHIHTHTHLSIHTREQWMVGSFGGQESSGTVFEYLVGMDSSIYFVIKINIIK